MLTLTAALLESDVEAAPGARLGSCWEVETVPEVTRELHGRPSARRPPLVPCHSAQGPVPGKDAGDGDRHCQELPASGFPTALSGARSSWMRLSGEENPQQVHVRLGGGFAYSQIHARGGRVTWRWPWDAHVPVPGGFVPLPCASWGLRALLGQQWGGPGESAAPCHQGSKRTRRGVPGGSWGAAIGARGVRCAAPAWHGGSSSLQLPALCCSKAHFVQPPARH